MVNPRKATCTINLLKILLNGLKMKFDNQCKWRLSNYMYILKRINWTTTDSIKCQLDDATSKYRMIDNLFIEVIKSDLGREFPIKNYWCFLKYQFAFTNSTFLLLYIIYFNFFSYWSDKHVVYFIFQFLFILIR